MSLIIRGLVGLLALLAGRQAFWIFVGAAGFLLGFNVAGRFLGDLPPGCCCSLAWAPVFWAHCWPLLPNA
jgi:hypothetical protein